MFSDLPLSWHARFYANCPTKIQKIAPMVHFLLIDKQNFEEPSISSMILKYASDSEIDSKNVSQKLQEFRMDWNEAGQLEPEWQNFKHGQLFNIGSAMIGSAYLSRGWHRIIPFEITVVPFESIPHDWISEYCRGWNLSSGYPGQTLLQVRIPPEFQWFEDVPELVEYGRVRDVIDVLDCYFNPFSNR